ncbi:cytidylyltransferase domain-containing protein [Vibrio splendidus]|uniref:acylneuraminate cytidylyltransferase family protein n=1 Tax=Vibrio splendidus TaxID=29497 RepID=UPI000C849771|nr:CMP-N-acetylneuraminic acid synthetase [Vibrio splendidus]PMO71088.1 CMP-N-acetylneuraminic acid synthetase [Vibrio splendidus]
MKVIIPLQTCSTRVKHKNIRPFYDGKSLFDLKCEQLVKAGVPLDKIYVSSESYLVKDICLDKGVNFLKRDSSLTGNVVKQPDLIGGILKDIPKDEEEIMWVQVTSPLFNEFANVIKVWNDVKSEHDSLVAVKKFSGHLLDETGNPLNYAFGHWHKVSQKLPNWYEVLWSCFILKRESIETVKYHIGMEPYLYQSNVTTVDIDTEDDFELASEIYQIRLAKGRV